jgi:hypothetical protein
MEKSVWVKIIWMGAALAIPAAIVAVQKPEPPRAAASPRRVMTLDQPVNVDISDRQFEGVRPIDLALVTPEAAKPMAMKLGGDKITMKGPGSASAPTTPTTAAPPTPAAVPEGSPAATAQHLTSVLAPVAGPNAMPSP